MSFARGTEIRLHTKMHFERSTLEPAAAALRELGWFLLFRNAQQVAVKSARLVFAMRRHRKLYVLDGRYRHTLTPTRCDRLLCPSSPVAWRSGPFAPASALIRLNAE